MMSLDCPSGRFNVVFCLFVNFGIILLTLIFSLFQNLSDNDFGFVIHSTGISQFLAIYIYAA